MMMRGRWATLPLLETRYDTRISDVRYREDAPERLLDYARGRYAGAMNYRKVFADLEEQVYLARSRSLALFNLRLLLWIRKVLEVDTPIAVGMPLERRGVAGLLELIGQYPEVTTYLSGDGGRQYLDDADADRFAEVGVELEWMNYVPPTGDSILSVLMDSKYPRKEIGL